MSGIVCLGTPEALIIKSGAGLLSIASLAAMAPILSTSISEILLSFTPDLDIIQFSVLLILFESCAAVSIEGGK